LTARATVWVMVKDSTIVFLLPCPRRWSGWESVYLTPAQK